MLNGMVIIVDNDDVSETFYVGFTLFIGHEVP